MSKEKLILGTAQFGTNYGVTNIWGQIGKEEIKSIESVCKKNEVMTLDTAESYGSAHNVIGEIFDENYQVITKIKVENDLNIKLKKILKILKRDRLHALLIHDENQINVENLSYLKELKQQGFTDKIGISVYDILNLTDKSVLGLVDIIQLPINAFSISPMLIDKLKFFKRFGIELHARSIFLQGIILQETSNLPEYFKKWENIFKKFQLMANSLDVSKIQLAFSYVNSIKEVDKIVVGIASKEQLVEILDLNKNFKVSGFLNEEENTDLVDPRSWKI